MSCWEWILNVITHSGFGLALSVYVSQTVRSYCLMLLLLWMKLPQLPYLSCKIDYISRNCEPKWTLCSWLVTLLVTLTSVRVTWGKGTSFEELLPLVWSVGQPVGYFLDRHGKSQPPVGIDIPGRWCSVVLERGLSKEWVTSQWAVFSMVFASVPASRLVPWVPPLSSLIHGC